MSLQVSESEEAASAVVRGIMLHNYLHLFGIAFFYYDHAITIGQEVNYLWMRPKKLSSYWFFVNRYIPFFANMIVTILTFVDLTPESCRKFSLFRQVFLVVNQIFVSRLLTLRIYALYECSRRMLAFMIGIGVTLIGAACWTLFSQQDTNSLEGVVGGCHIGLDRETAFRIAGAWEALLVYDCLIFTLTIRKTWKGRKAYAMTGTSMPLVTLILRDGAIYFAVMGLANFGNVFTFYLGGTFLRGGLSMSSSAISTTLMTRLMLNLHKSADDGLLTTQAMTTNLEWEPQSHLESTSASHPLMLDNQSYRSTTLEHCFLKGLSRWCRSMMCDEAMDKRV
ncbi:hypothetical protein CPC08DRAFT_823474 [Agrocybe pediades]|nr:hypothetical protein CPC08DRAFT_823474 [Agrocybe pediades]